MLTAWLVVVLVVLAGGAYLDGPRMAAFKQLTSSRARARAYLRWTGEGFAFFGALTVVTLWLLGQPLVLRGLPADLAAATALLRDAPQQQPKSDDASFGFALGVGLGLSVLVTLMVVRVRRLRMPVIGDVEALIPRTGLERWAALPLCLNAGFSEELFFRFALPLLLMRVTGSAWVALGLSAVTFGLMHAYQGWKGVLGTMALGALLSFLYVGSGSLVRVMVMHALMDVMAMIVRPLIAGQRRPSPEPTSAT